MEINLEKADEITDQVLEKYPDATEAPVRDLPYALADGVICCEKRMNSIIADNVGIGFWTPSTGDACREVYNVLMKADKKPKKPKKGK